jgi:McrBC 5-methylcytosine restriction system component
VKRRGARVRSTHASASGTPCFEATDSSITSISASFLLRGTPPRDPNTQLTRLAGQFIAQNRAYLRQLDTEVEQRYDGTSVSLEIKTHTRIGAVPLLSPTTGRAEYGIVVKPRFDWQGLGPMLGDMGWRIIPAPLDLPMLPRSDRKIPAWVLSAIVLFRLQALLKQLERRFEILEEDRTAPKGSVNWTSYATRQIPRGAFLAVPCRFPDLRDDRQLKSAIRFTLQKQLAGLEGQRTSGVFVLKLIEICAGLLDRVRDVPSREPGPRELESWLRGSLKTESFRDGIQAVEWTVDDRGLAGLSDLTGLPWAMSMEKFFEAWTETVLADVARRIGGVLRTGRQRQTVAALSWDPPYVGSQRSLVPDLMLERGASTIIIDAKYKEHWEELQARRWGDIEDEIRERHRADLLQVLAYANLATTPRIIVCLAYPCARSTWDSLQERGRLFHRATLRAGERLIEIILTAFPMGVPSSQVATELADELRRGVA